jgi:hypothetical protein
MLTVICTVTPSCVKTWRTIELRSRSAWINAIHSLTAALARLAGHTSRRLAMDQRIKKFWRKHLLRGAAEIVPL